MKDRPSSKKEVSLKTRNLFHSDDDDDDDGATDKYDAKDLGKDLWLPAIILGLSL